MNLESARYQPNGNPKSRKSKSKCKSCNAIRNNKALKDRYYHAWFEREAGDGSETLEMIAKDIGISSRAIYQHARNHMKRNVAIKDVAMRKKIMSSRMRAEAMKDLEISFDHDLLVAKEDYEVAVDQVIADGMAQMKVSGKDITVNQILAAAKLKGEWKFKKRGQDTEIIKMMYRGASGFQRPSANVGSPGTN